MRFRVSHLHVDPGGTEDIQLAFRSNGVGRAGRLLLWLQAFASPCNCSRMAVISGRAGGEDSYSSSHVSFNNAHNESENPAVGRSGRFPLRSFCMTAASGLTCSKGRRPVTTYRGSEVLQQGTEGNGLIRTSRMVIPRAYVSMLFEGNFFRNHLLYPYLSGSRISGAIHRIVPPTLWLLSPSTEIVSTMIAVSPKSAKQARHSELMRTLACVSASSVNVA